MDLLIATHNSATGEKPKSIWSWLLTPFAKCQSKTIKEQYDAGCRMFDLRVRWDKMSWRCAHGLWMSKKTVPEILHTIDSFPEHCYVLITYEGKLKDKEDREDFIIFCKWCRSSFKNIYFGSAAAKYSDKDTKVDWIEVLAPVKTHASKKGFLPLDGKHWQTYLPIPWLWNQLYTKNHKFDSETFTFVDFL